MIKIGELIERQLSVAFCRTKKVRFPSTIGRQISELLHARGSRSCGIPISQPAPSRDLLQSSMKHACPKAVLESLVKVAYLPKLFFDPTTFHTLLKVSEFGGR